MKFSQKVSLTVLKAKHKVEEKFTCKKGEMGMGMVVSACVAIIIVAFVLIPGLRSLAQAGMTALTNWWTNTVSPQIFPTS